MAPQTFKDLAKKLLAEGKTAKTRSEKAQRTSAFDETDEQEDDVNQFLEGAVDG
jgi:hypothetical protein